MFYRIGVVISEGIVSRIDFTLHERALLMGDLEWQWGTPDVAYADGRHMKDFFWSDDGVSASVISDTAQFSVFLPVWTVTFRDAL
jgi:hypothetical protein